MNQIREGLGQECAYQKEAGVEHLNVLTLSRDPKLLDLVRAALEASA